MAIKSLNRFLIIRSLAIWARKGWMSLTLGVKVHQTASVSMSSTLRPGRRGDIEIGADTLVAFKTLIYTWDSRAGRHRPVRIGERCFIGGGSMIAPGVTIGDECIVGAGAVVFEDVPSRCIVGGNPARVLRREIEVGRFGRLAGADDNSRRLWGGD